jgi:hypothetical protein
MKRSDLKNMIKECVREVLFEEGVLSSVIAEVAFGITKATKLISEAKYSKEAGHAVPQNQQEPENRKESLLETKRKMLDAIGKGSMSHIFEGVDPLAAAQHAGPHSPLANLSPTDSGVDISGIPGIAPDRWKILSKG